MKTLFALLLLGCAAPVAVIDSAATTAIETANARAQTSAEAQAIDDVRACIDLGLDGAEALLADGGIDGIALAVMRDPANARRCGMWLVRVSEVAP